MSREQDQRLVEAYERVRLDEIKFVPSAEEKKKGGGGVTIFKKGSSWMWKTPVDKVAKGTFRKPKEALMDWELAYGE